MAQEMQQVMKELKGIKKELLFIKEHMFDPDSIMTAEEAKRFKQSIAEFKAGKTTSLAALSEELGL